MSIAAHSTPELVEQVFDRERCRQQLRFLRPPAGEATRWIVLEDGPLAGRRFPVDRYARSGTSAGMVQATSRGLVSVTYELRADGTWRFRGLAAVGW